MTDSPRITGPTLKVLAHLIANVSGGQAGSDISKATGLASGTLYPILARLEAAGWLSSQWEEVDPVAAGRPRKRLYELTGQGVNASRAAFASILPVGGSFVWQA